MTQMEDLIDHASIADWKAAHDAAHARKLATAIDLASAADAHRNAERASDVAVASGGDAMSAETTLIAAETTLRVARKVADAAAATFKRLQDRENVVRGKAHVPVYLHGVRQRIAAAAKGDAARAMLAEADDESKAASDMMRQACSAGCSDAFGGLDGPHVLRTEIEERAHWTSRQVDPDAGTHPWRPE
jgi:hypothetical protein